MPLPCFIWLLLNFRDFDVSSLFFDFENFVSFAFDHLKLVAHFLTFRNAGNFLASKIMDRSYSSIIRITYCILSLRHVLVFLFLLSSWLSWVFQDFQSDLDTLVAFQI